MKEFRIVSLAVGLLALAASSLGQVSEPQIAVSGAGNALALGPKQHLVNGFVSSLYLSQDGKSAFLSRLILNTDDYISVLSQEPPKKPTLAYTLVNCETGRAIDLQGVNPESHRFIEGSVLPNGAVVGVFSGNDESLQAVVISQTGRITSLVNVSRKDLSFLFNTLPIHNSKLTAVRIVGFSQEKGVIDQSLNLLLVLDADGNVIQSFNKTLPAEYTYLIDSPATNTLVLTGRAGAVSMNVQTGEASPLSDFEAALKNPGPFPLPNLIKTKDEKSSANSNTLHYVVYLEESDTAGSKSSIVPTTEENVPPPVNTQKSSNRQLVPALLGANLDQAQLNEDKTFAFIADSGGLYRVPLVKIDADAYRRLLAERTQREAIINAKQVAMGVMLYSTDYDDMLPPHGDWSERVNPYLKNRDIMKNFNYLLNGGSSSDYSDPSTTVLGIISTEFGDAIAYLDGHVIWKDNKSPSIFLALWKSTEPKQIPLIDSLEFEFH